MLILVHVAADEDVIRATRIDIGRLANMVAETGASVDSVEAFFSRVDNEEKTMVEIGVLRYPDIDNPFFKVYRIQLNAWRNCTRVLFAQVDTNGITGTFTSRKFAPRESVLQVMKPAVKEKAVKEAEGLFDD